MNASAGPVIQLAEIRWRPLERSRIMEAESVRALKPREAGIREVPIALEPDMEFDRIVDVL